MFSNKDLIIVFTENEPRVKMLDLLRMWDQGGEHGLASVSRYVQQ